MAEIWCDIYLYIGIGQLAVLISPTRGRDPGYIGLIGKHIDKEIKNINELSEIIPSPEQSTLAGPLSGNTLTTAQNLDTSDIIRVIL
ncbi:hypothetical protein J6590_024061 [Homalodisca vitripennis]|nr:hypothetical protein J6590_024061 [Homalodisca vitripennis]